MLSKQTPFPQKVRRFDEEGIASQPTKSIFILQPHQQTAIFYFNSDQNCLRRTLLITAKAIFIKVHQNNNSKQLNKCV